MVVDHGVDHVLHGSLDAFGLSDVFALLAATRKTGTLRLRNARGEGWLEFRDGAVAYAVSDTRRMALASRLLGGGLVDDAQLRHIVSAQRGGAATLARALLDAGVVDEQRFAALVREQIQDAVFELMRSSAGEFSFDASAPGGGVPDEDGIRLTVTTEQLVSEAGRRLREWEQIAGHVLSVDAVVTLAPQPPSDSGTVTMGVEQWRLLAFVDGRRTVRDLVDLIGVGEYATCQAVAALVDAGLLEVVDPAAGVRAGVAELAARHDLLHRLEERELGSSVSRPPSREAPPARDETPSREAPPARDEAPRGATVLATPASAPEPQSALDDPGPDLVPLSEVLVDEPEPQAEPDLQPEPEPIPYRADEDARADDAAPPPSRADDTFDREEVERELAALGFRRAALDDVTDQDGHEPPDPYRAARAEENRGLLSRIIDGRKQS